VSGIVGVRRYRGEWECFGVAWVFVNVVSVGRCGNEWNGVRRDSG
jgi:hypothetical protein